VDSRNQPLRQCVGCRKVRSKEDLLRFVRNPSAEAVFDRESRLEGRGFYLCPSEQCFVKAYRNKRIRANYFRKREQINELIYEVREELLNMIKKDLIRCKKMAYLKDGPCKDNTIREDDLVLYCLDNPPEEKVRTHTAARAGGSKAYRLPDGCECSSPCLIVSRECPIAPRLAMNLQKYGLLSSKGLAR
jgi:predicted RNA-binding protein YlxR (DUF448 family)